MDPRTWDAPLPLIIGALFVIVFLRANGTYWLGRLVRRGARHTQARHIMDSPGYLRAVSTIDRWGAPAVTVSFMTIGIQTLINLAAGATGMSLRRYLPAVTVGCVIWALIYGTVGFVGLEALGLLYARWPAPTIIGTALLVGGFAAYIAVRVRAARRGA